MRDDLNPYGVDFGFASGVELTYVHPMESPRDQNEYLENGKRKSLMGLACEVLEFHVQVLPMCGGRVHRDPGCVEFSTPVIRSWAGLRQMWDYGLALSDMFGLTPEVEHLAGGMGHIHLEMTSSRVAKSLLVDSFCRPYLAWVFAHPSAVKYCKPRACFPDHTRPVPLGMDTETFFYEKFVDFHCAAREREPHVWGTTKSRYTMEFRIFDMASTWEEQYLHMAFAQAYAGFLRNKVASGIHPVLSYDRAYGTERRAAELQAMNLVRAQYCSSPKKCVRDFQELIEILGLPWKDYQWLTVKNLQEQFKWGEQHPKSKHVVDPRIVTTVYDQSAGSWPSPVVPYYPVNPVVHQGAARV